MSDKPSYGQLEERVKELEREVADLKRTEKALRESEKIHRLISENTSDLIAITTFSLNPTYTYLSPSHKALGYKPEELIGKPALDLIHPDDKKELLPLLSQYVTAKLKTLLTRKGKDISEKIVYRVRDKSGNWRYLESTGDLIEKDLLLFVSRDITEKKRAEEELRKAYTELEGRVEERTAEHSKTIELLKQEISERKRVEEELRDSEERLKILFEYAPDGYYLNDLKGTFIDGNRVAERITGYKREELIGKSFLKLKLLSPKQILKAAAVLAKNMQGKPTGPDEFTLNRKDGTQVAVEITTFPVKIKGQTLVLGIARDISEHKLAEEALKESEEKYRTILDSIEEAYFEVDIDGNFTFFNDSLSKILGYSKDELAGMNNRDYMPPESSKKIYNLFNQIYKTGNPIKEVDYEIIRKDGSRGFHELSASLMRDEAGHPIGFRGIAHDVTEVKLAEEALKESEEKYRTILENIEDGYYEVDIAGSLTFFNDSLCKMTGSSKDELMGMNNREYMDEENAKKVYQIFNKVYNTGKPTKGFEYEIILRKDGSKRHVESSLSLIKDSEGNRVGFRGIIRDITERKQMEEERRDLEEKLRHSEKMEALGTLAGGVAHDLNNVLSGLVSYPELLLLEIPEDSPLRKPILTIQKSGEKAAAIVQDLLTLARRGVAVTEVVELNHIISEYVKSPEHEKAQSFHPRVLVETDLETDLLNILGSPVHLSKTVMNLVSNAAEAMPDGGKILISTENRYIDRPIRGYDYVEEGDYVVLIVSDTGVGISSEDIKRIFEPFYTKKVMGRSGTGLGMAVVWGTVKDHKGYIDVQSTEGKGTTFTLYFPVTRKELSKDESLLSMEDYIGKGESILVVDDVVEQRDLASVMLKRLGYSATTVSSGEEAVEYMKNNSADLLVLDMIMDPGIDGLDTYRQILELHPGQKAIIASGFSETDRVRQAQKLGAGAYVKKPFLLERIGVAVRDELGK